MDGEQTRERAAGVGAALRACRIEMGASLADAAETLCIRQCFLAAIEDGRFSELPGPTYAIGFLRGYAEYLGLDSDEVVRRYRAEAANVDAEAMLRFPVPETENTVPKGGILIVGAFIAVIAYGAWYVVTAQDDLVSDVVGPLPDRLASLLSSESNPEGTEDTSASPATERQSEEDSLSPRPTTEATAESVATSAPPPAAPAATRENRSGDAASSERRAIAATPDAPPHQTSQPGVSAEAAVVSPRDVVDVTPETEEAAETASLADSSESEPSADADASDAVADDTSAREPRSIQSASIGSSTATAMPALDSESEIVLKANEASWIEIRDRFGRRVTSRLLEPGDTYAVPPTSGPDLLMTVGNAGGLEVILDGQPMPRLGDSGVVRRGVELDAESLRNGASLVN